MFTFSHLSFQLPSDLFAQGYDRLYAYIDGHPEIAAIAQTID